MSSFRVFPIVTGHGEVRAFPVLLRRIIVAVDPYAVFTISTPWRCRESQLLDPASPVLAQAVGAGITAVGETGAVVVLLDCEDQCPGEVGPALLSRAKACAGEGLVSVVCAYREFETWFLWGLESLAGQHRLPAEVQAPQNPDAIRGAKEWLGRQLAGGSYSPTIDQKVFARALDLQLARRSDSFDKLYREVETLVGLLGQRTAR